MYDNVWPNDLWELAVIWKPYAMQTLVAAANVEDAKVTAEITARVRLEAAVRRLK